MEVKYSGLVDRATKVKEAEARGLTMLHDNFDPDWKRGDEPHGIMDFDVVESVSLPTARDPLKELDELKAKVAALEAAAKS